MQPKFFFSLTAIIGKAEQKRCVSFAWSIYSTCDTTLRGLGLCVTLSYSVLLPRDPNSDFRGNWTALMA